jgi:hypothetical protein
MNIKNVTVLAVIIVITSFLMAFIPNPGPQPYCPQTPGIGTCDMVGTRPYQSGNPGESVTIQPTPPQSGQYPIIW